MYFKGLSGKVNEINPFFPGMPGKEVQSSFPFQ